MRVNVAEAKAKLSELIDRALAGEEIEVTRRGQPAVRLVPSSPAKKKLDIAAIRELTRQMTPQTESAGEFMRRMRDEARY